MTAPPARSTVIIYIASTFLFWAGLYVYIPILAPYAKHLGGSMTVVGLVIASYGLMQLLFRIPLGVWSDRVGRRKPFVAASLLMVAVSGIGLALAPTPEWMIFARSLAGIAACGWVIWSVTYAGFFPPDRTTAAMSHLATCSALAQMISTYAGGWIAETYGWVMPFYMGTVLSLIGLACLLPVPDTVIKSSRPLTFQRIVSISMTPLLLFVSFISALSQYVTFITIYGFTSVYATDIGATKAQLGALTLVGLLCQTAAAFLSGTWCAPRFGKRATLIGGFLITGFATTMIPYTDTVTALYIAQAIGGIGRGLIGPILMAMAVQAVPQDERGTAMGVYQALYAIGMFAGPAIGGVLGDWVGLSGVFLSGGLICMIAVVLTGMSRQLLIESGSKGSRDQG